jgi:hypothetical protein
MWAFAIKQLRVRVACAVGLGLDASEAWTLPWFGEHDTAAKLGRGSTRQLISGWYKLVQTGYFAY